MGWHQRRKRGREQVHKAYATPRAGRVPQSRERTSWEVAPSQGHTSSATWVRLPLTEETRSQGPVSLISLG